MSVLNIISRLIFVLSLIKEEINKPATVPTKGCNPPLGGVVHTLPLDAAAVFLHLAARWQCSPHLTARWRCSPHLAALRN